MSETPDLKVLFVTQAVDEDDLYMSFVVRWIAALAGHVESVQAVCLKEGRHALPGNVRVHSLGKERGARMRIAYALSFLALAWRLRKQYDAVFVHMNEEYLLIAGPLWKLLGKRLYLWRNHYAGSLMTDLAASYCAKVFCTSKHSYTAKYPKTVLMPLGIDIERFIDKPGSTREPRSILFFARLSPSKRPEMLLEALGILHERGVAFTASIVGSALPEDAAYEDALHAQATSLGLTDRVTFMPGVPHEDAHAVFAAHDIYVNAARSGMFDKMLFEAAAAGDLVLAVSDDFASQAGERFQFRDAESLADRLIEMLALTPDERLRASERLKSLARAESLATLADRLSTELSEAP